MKDLYSEFNLIVMEIRLDTFAIVTLDKGKN